jgi:ABC-2 type transport system permease protein
VSAVESVPYQALGRPIRGPRALTHDWARFWHLSFNIAVLQWKLRFFGSALGYVWSLVRPLLMFGVLWVFFTKIGHIGQGPQAAPGRPDHFYGAQLLGSIVLFTFFSVATGGAVRSVLENEGLVRKIQFPRLVIPTSVVLLGLFDLGLNLVVFFIFALASGVRPMVTWLELPLILAVLIVFSTGLAMLLSSLYVYFRDVAPIWDVISQILFYSSPIIVPMSTIEAKLSPTLLHIYMLSPLATVLQQFRYAIVNNATPKPSSFLGGPLGLLEPLAITAAIFVLGFVVFNRTAPYVAENL